MRSQATHSTAYLRVLVDALDEAGCDWHELCRKSDIDPAVIDEVNGHVSTRSILQLWEAARRKLDHPHLGLHLGERARPRFANVGFYLMMSSATLREGQERMARYQAVIIGGGWRFDLVDEGGNVFERFGPVPRMPDILCELVEFGVVLTLKYARWVVDLDFHPLEVRFAHEAPPDVSEHERVFGCPVKFGAPATGLLMPAEVMDRPSAYAHPELAREHEEFAKRFLAEIEAPGLVAQLRQLLVGCLESGGLDLPAAARALGMSPRTLQRRLADERTTFAKLLAGLRREIAEHELRTTGASVDEIAYITGYSEASTFERAFKRWTHKTPREFRLSG
jgi:AraC-like DNA-binding protein